MQKFFLLFIMILAGVLTCKSQTEGRLEIRNYAFKNSNNQTVRLQDFKGKVVIIDFWASWCQSCIYSFPTTTEVMRKFEGKPVVLLTINTDKQKGKWKSALRKYKVPGISLYASKKHPILNALAVQQLPRYMILDKKGLVYQYQSKSPYEETKTIELLISE